MTSEKSNNNINHDKDGLHITELTELALYNPAMFDAIEKMLDMNVSTDRIIRFMNRILENRKEVV